MITPTDEKDIQVLKERAIAKFVALGITEAELQALGIRSDGNN
jgi:hypothetical protein